MLLWGEYPGKEATCFWAKHTGKSLKKYTKAMGMISSPTQIFYTEGELKNTKQIPIRRNLLSYMCLLCFHPVLSIAELSFCSWETLWRFWSRHLHCWWTDWASARGPWKHSDSWPYPLQVTHRRHWGTSALLGTGSLMAGLQAYPLMLNPGLLRMLLTQFCWFWSTPENAATMGKDRSTRGFVCQLFGMEKKSPQWYATYTASSPQQKQLPLFIDVPPYWKASPIAHRIAANVALAFALLVTKILPLRPFCASFFLAGELMTKSQFAAAAMENSNKIRLSGLKGHTLGSGIPGYTDLIAGGRVVNSAGGRVV